jgi:VWFA-related protein
MAVSTNLRCLLVLGCAVFCAGQTPEVASHDSQPTFTTRSNLVLVRVVVRDKQGRVNGTLQKEDFQLFDKGKPQAISKFSVEQSAGHKVTAPVSESPLEKSPGELAPPVAPDRYIAYVFDDLHLSFGDLAQARTAAERHLTESLTATSRAAIYTTSGHPLLDFTDDIAKLKDTLLRIQPGSTPTIISTGCPSISYYQADLIRNKNDPMALQAAALDAIGCAHLTDMNSAQAMAQSEASRVVALGEQDSRISLRVLNDVVRRISAMPGQRSVVVVSPGFLVLDQRFDELEMIDRAIRANVTISSLDARGLYALVPGGDASQSGGSIGSSVLRMQYQTDSANAEGDVLGELADGTGGTWVHNTNDLAGGFKRIAAAPEYYYVLGFSPQNLKFDGSYHNLKVTLKNPAGLSLQARRGYFAPKHEVDGPRKLSARSRRRCFPATNGTTFRWNCTLSFSNPAMWPQNFRCSRGSMSGNCVFEKQMAGTWTR